MSELTGQDIPVMKVLLFMKAIQPDQSNPNSIHEGNRFSSKTLGKSLFYFQNDRASHGLAGQF